MSLIQKEKTKEKISIYEKRWFEPKLSSVIRGLIGKFKVGMCKLYNKDNDSFCILGALAFAGGMSRDEIGIGNYCGIEKMYPQLRDLVTVDGIQRDLMSTLFHLNDNGRSWNEIADKVEELKY